MSDTTPGTTPVEAKTTDTKTAADTTPAAKTATTEPKAKTATTTNTTVTDKTAEPVVAPKTTTKAKSEAKTADTKTIANADEKPQDKADLTIKVKNTGVTLFETRTGTMLESGKTTTIKVNDEVTRNQVLKNIKQLNYLHGDTLDVK